MRHVSHVMDESGRERGINPDLVESWEEIPADKGKGVKGATLTMMSGRQIALESSAWAEIKPSLSSAPRVEPTGKPGGS